MNKLTSDYTVLKKKFENIKSVSYRNRGGKRYLTITLKEWTSDGMFYLNQIRASLKDFFPHIYMTSGSCSGATFRLNNIDFL